MGQEKGEKGKYIYVDANKKRLLVSDFGVSLRSVCAALNYETNSGLAKKIRASALNNGGVVYDPALRVAAHGQDVKVRIIEQGETL